MPGPVLLAIHYQNEVVHRDGRIKLGVGDEAAREALIAAAARLLHGARDAGVPVVSVRIAFRRDHAEVIRNAEIWRRVAASGAMVEGSWGAAFHDALAPREGEHVVTHTRNNAFYGAPLDEVLRALGAERLIVAGVATNFAVESTVRHASDAGWDVTVAADACSARTSEVHRASLETMAMLANVATVDDILAELAARDPS